MKCKQVTQMRFIYVKITYYILLILSIITLLLLSFVIPHGGYIIDDPNVDYEFFDEELDPIEQPDYLPSILESAVVIGSYQTPHLIINIYKFRMFNSTVYAADVVVRDVRLILSGLAYNRFGGSNYVQTVSTMAENHNAVFAINSDYANHYDYGLVIRNGEVLRDTISYRDATVLWHDGMVTSFPEKITTADELMDLGAWQLWSFGPVLVKNSLVVASATDGIPRNMVKNPRSGFGWVSDHRYMFVTIDGRIDSSVGVDIEEFAEIMLMLDCQEAYNFDGGGSATMYFDGQVINRPSDGKERKVGDCVYIIG